MNSIILFNKALKGAGISFEEINKLALKMGYLVHPDCCTVEVLEFLRAQPMNYNTTFYKEWNDIITKSRFEIYLDQIRSYAGTYGSGEEWIPNTKNPTIDYLSLKVITPITQEEINLRCTEMLYSGIALNADTLVRIFTIMEVDSVDIAKVKNKEALMHLHLYLGTAPSDPVEFVRYLIFLATGKTLLIKDRQTISLLSASRIDLNKYIRNEADKVCVAEVFHRFKPIFLALKKNPANKAIVNELRRLADRYHKPMQVGFFESILSEPKLIPQLPAKLASCSNFKKVLLLQTILVRQKELDMRFFGIRNGKLWAKTEKSKTKAHYSIIYAIIYKSLIDSLRLKATSVKIPAGVKLTLPTSEKSFIGNFPLGTSFRLSDSDAIIGIHWRGEDGASDLDLAMLTLDGKKYGWNAAWKSGSNSVIYSGDMTSANPEATELFYMASGKASPMIIKVNAYSAQPLSKFKLFLAKEKIGNLGSMRNHMVDPNDILFSVDCIMNSKEQCLAVMTGQDLVLAQFRTGNKIVSGNSITNKYADYACKTLDCYLDLETVLLEAGYTINDGKETIDLTNLSKDTLIGLLM